MCVEVVVCYINVIYLRHSVCSDKLRQQCWRTWLTTADNSTRFGMVLFTSLHNALTFHLHMILLKKTAHKDVNRTAKERHYMVYLS